MTEASESPNTSPGLITRAAGMIFSPGATFAQILRAPSPWGILFLVAVVIGLASALPYVTENGRQMMLDIQIEATQNVLDMTGTEMTDEMLTQLEGRGTFNAIAALVSPLVTVPIMALFFGALFWGLFNAVLGGTASFKEVLTIVAHGMVIMALGTAVSMPIMMMQGVMSMGGPFTLGALVPMLDETSFIARLAGATSVFMIWQTIVVAIGLAVLYKRKAGPIATGLVIAYMLFTAAIVSVFGAFMGAGS
jgi:hypothetical protein